MQLCEQFSGCNDTINNCIYRLDIFQDDLFKSTDKNEILKILSINYLKRKCNKKTNTNK